MKRRTGVTVKQLNAECDDQRLHELSEYIVDYRKYGPWLGLSDADIEDIEGNPYILSSKKLKAAEVFKKWHRMKSCEATYLQLLEVALKLNDGSGAEKICQICAKGNYQFVFGWERSIVSCSPDERSKLAAQSMFPVAKLMINSNW